MKWRVVLILVGLALCAWRFASVTIAAETIRSQGEIILFELAPVDPRALFLGDYMTLRYHLGPPELTSDLTEERDSGVAIVRLEDGVGTVIRHAISEKPPKLAPNERLIRYRVNSRGRMTIGGEAYYFQSGTGERYAEAEYGIFKVMPDGRALLSGLADNEKRPILIAGGAPDRLKPE